MNYIKSSKNAVNIIIFLFKNIFPDGKGDAIGRSYRVIGPSGNF